MFTVDVKQQRYNNNNNVAHVIFVEMLKILSYIPVTQNIELRDRLLLTDPKELVEASLYDMIWVLDWNDPRISNKHLWRDRNLLRQILVDVRDKMKEYKDN